MSQTPDWRRDFSTPIAVFPVPTPIVAGLTLGLLVYTIGPISGCHINPAVTTGLFSIGKLEAPAAGGYIVAQVIGGSLTLGIAFAAHSTITDQEAVSSAAP